MKRAWLTLLVTAVLGTQPDFRSSHTKPLTTPRSGHTATLLPDGRVLIAGGDAAGNTAAAELFEPRSKRYAVTGSMRQPRTHHTATLLYNGRVLIVGGNFNSSAELYDPANGEFASTGSTHTNFLADHVAILLPNGKVLVAGGTTNNVFKGEVHAEIYDPATGAFNVTGDLSLGRTRLRATLLPNGKVLVTGGASEFDATGFRQWRSFASTEIYDSLTGTFSAGPDMTASR